MKKPFPIILIIVILLIFGTILGLSQKNSFSIFNQIQNLETLKIKEISPTTYGFKTLDENVIEIGTERHSPPQPYLKLNKWNNEVFLKVTIPFNTQETPLFKGNKITFSTINKGQTLWQRIVSKLFALAYDNQEDQPQIDIVFYPRESEEIIEIDDQGKEHRFVQNEQGGVEFDTILYQRPETNKIIFPIETKGLKFYYQGELTQEEKDNGAYRPENIVGSYAVYHESKQGDYSKLGSKDYKTGKVFHIYRPQIEDSNNKRCWGNLKIRNNFLIIEIPQEFLDEAVYPVRVDPNFGYETAGGTNQGVHDRITGSLYTIADPGIVNSLTAYIFRAMGPGYCPTYKCMIYKHSDSTLSGTTEEKVCCESFDGWITFDFPTSSKPGLVHDNDYVLTCWGGEAHGNEVMHWDDGGAADQGHYQSLTYGTPPAVASFSHESPTSTRQYSVYSTYTLAQTSIPVGYQEYATSSLNYGSGTDLTVSTNMPVELDLPKPVSNPSTSTDDVHRGLGIPSTIEVGKTYTGTTTFEAKAD